MASPHSLCDQVASFHIYLASHYRLSDQSSQSLRPDVTSFWSAFTDCLISCHSLSDQTSQQVWPTVTVSQDKMSQPVWPAVKDCLISHHSLSDQTSQLFWSDRKLLAAQTSDTETPKKIVLNLQQYKSTAQI